MHRAFALVVASTCLAAASSASGQTSQRPDVLSAVEIRAGGTTGFGTASGPPSIGAAVDLRPWSVLASRLSIYLAGDFRHHSRREVFDDEFNVRARVGRSAFLLGGALGVDVVRTPRATLAVRGGAVFVRDYATFEVGSGIAGFVNDPGRQWETVCAFDPYRRRCQADYRVTGTVAAGLRYSPRPNGSFYVGGDYMRLTQGQSLFVGVVGVR